MRQAMSRPASDSAMCSSRRTGIPFGPDQLAGSVSQATVSRDRSSCRGLAPAGPERAREPVGRPAPRRRPPLHRDERQVDGDREQHRRHRAEQHLGREAVALALEDEEAEAAEPVADRPGDRHEADRRHAGDPEPGDRSAASRAAARRAAAAATTRSPCRRPPRGRRRGTASKPATVLRTKIRSVYRTSGISAVSSDRPVIGTSAANSARLGIVYRIPATPVIGA